MSPVPWDSDGDEGSQTHQSRSEGFSCFVGKKSRYSAIPLLHGSNQQKSDSLTMEALKLYYFDIPGKGECIRLLCAYAGLCLEDIRIPLDNREVFDNLKKEGKLIFGQLPALQINDRGDMITQSAAIMRYLGKITTMYPKCPIEAALVDAIIDEEADLCTGLSVSRYRDRFGYGCLDEATVKSIRASLNNEVIPHHLTFLENILSKSKTGWIANTEGPSCADFILVPRLQWLASGANDGIDKTILDPFPLLKDLIAKLMNLPSIKAYYDK